jgi:hypothetical protein
LEETVDPVKDWQIPENQNKKVVQNLKWIISTPIISGGALVGVLNADFSCERPADEVKDQVHKYLGDMAASFSGII